MSGEIPGRVLAIDYGTKRVGFALSDDMRWTARALEVWARKGMDADLARISALIREHEVTRVLVGVPNRLDGTEGDAARRALEFAAAIRAHVAPTPVDTRDEALTTWEAKTRMRAAGIPEKSHKQWVDAYAALVLLEEELGLGS